MLKKIGCLTGTDRQWGRRDFVKVGSLGFLGMNLAQSLRLQAASSARLSSRAKAKACILLWLEGGPAQMDTWDPKTNSSFRPISTNVDGIQVSELLPKLAKRMDKLALIRSMSSFGDDHPQAVHSASAWVRPTACRPMSSCRAGSAASSTRSRSVPPSSAPTTRRC